MTKKPLCNCGHKAKEHMNVKYTTKKGINKEYRRCRIKECVCKEYNQTKKVDEVIKNDNQPIKPQ